MKRENPSDERELQTQDSRTQQPPDTWTRFASALHPEGAVNEPAQRPSRHGLRKFAIVAGAALLGLGIVVIAEKLSLYSRTVAYLSVVEQSIMGPEQNLRRESESSEEKQPAKSRHGMKGSAGKTASGGKGGGSDLTPTIDAQGHVVRSRPPFRVTAIDARGEEVVQSENAEFAVNIVPPRPSKATAGQPVVLPSIRNSSPNAVSIEQYRQLAATFGSETKTVILQGTITQNGTVEALRQISGPPELLQAAIDVVKHAKFQPSRSTGSVETQIAVHFTVDNK